jgi:hypothetical protein
MRLRQRFTAGSRRRFPNKDWVVTTSSLDGVQWHPGANGPAYLPHQLGRLLRRYPLCGALGMSSAGVEREVR